MADYALTQSEIVVRTADNLYIPNDPLNRHRREYEDWLAAGNVPDPAPPPTPMDR